MLRQAAREGIGAPSRRWSTCGVGEVRARVGIRARGYRLLSAIFEQPSLVGEEALVGGA